MEQEKLDMEQEKLEKRMKKMLPTIKAKGEVEAKELEKLIDETNKAPIQVLKTPNIYERLLNISNDLNTIAKNLEVSMGKNGKYKAVGEADVLREVKPLELKHRVYSYPVEREIIESGTLESEYNGQTKKQLFERIKVTYRFINIDKPEEFVDITSYGDGIDSGDKSVGKAMTYADKYALLKAYKIVTGDDPDQEASQENLKEIKAAPKLDEKLLGEAFELNMELEKVAIYFKKSLAELTNDDLKKAIAQKKKALGGVK